MDELRQILERTILVAGVDGVEKMFLTDDREVNSEMLKSICDQIKDGSLVYFDQRYYGSYLLFEFVRDVKNRFPDLIDLKDVYNYVIKYWEWHAETYRVNLEELVNRN